MKPYLLATLSLLVASYSGAQLPYTEKQVIDYAKSIDAKTLDPSLPSQRLEDWLQSEVPHAQSLKWLVEGTCWNRPFKKEDYPLCAHVRIIRNGQWGEFLVQVGTFHKGIGGLPKLYWGINIGEGEPPLAYDGRLRATLRPSRTSRTAEPAHRRWSAEALRRDRGPSSHWHPGRHRKSNHLALSKQAIDRAASNGASLPRGLLPATRKRRQYCKTRMAEDRHLLR